MSSACEHDHHDEAGLKGAALASQLAMVEQRCASHGQKMTPPRRRVLELLLEAGAPVKAYDLMAAYAPGAGAKPPTVYRALEFLEREGLAHRIQSLNAYVACRREGGHHAAFLICDCCGATREVEPAGGETLTRQAGKAGFSISGVMLEAHGLCADCQAHA